MSKKPSVRVFVGATGNRITAKPLGKGNYAVTVPIFWRTPETEALAHAELKEVLKQIAAEQAAERRKAQNRKNRKVKFSEDQFRKDYEKYMRDYPRATFTLWADECPLASRGYIFDHYKDAKWRQDRRRRRKARKPS